MKKTLLLCLCVGFLVAHSGCASIVSGSSQDVNIRSNPSGATVLINGMSSGVTPLTTDLKRKKRHHIVIKKDGYLEENRTTKRGFNWWYAGNIVFGGVVGLIVDPCTGAMYKVDPSEITVDLQKNGDSVGGNDAVQKGGTESQGDVAVLDSKVIQIEKLNKLKEKGLLTTEEFETKKKEILGLPR